MLFESASLEPLMPLMMPSTVSPSLRASSRRLSRNRPPPSLIRNPWPSSSNGLATSSLTAPRLVTPMAISALWDLLIPPATAISDLPKASSYMAGTKADTPDEQALSTTKFGPLKLNVFAIRPLRQFVIQPGRVCSVDGGKRFMNASTASSRISSRACSGILEYVSHAWMALR